MREKIRDVNVFLYRPTRILISGPNLHPRNRSPFSSQKFMPEFAFWLPGCACLAVLSGVQIFQSADGLNSPTTQRAIGTLVAMILLIVLWSVTGFAILRRSRRAIPLSYVGAGVAVIGILARRIVPLDVMLSIPTFLIIPYLRKRSAMLN